MKLKCPECGKTFDFQDDCKCGRCGSEVSAESLIHKLRELERDRMRREEATHRLDGFVLGNTSVSPGTKRHVRCLLCSQRIRNTTAVRRRMKKMGYIEVVFNGEVIEARPCSKLCLLEQLGRLGTHRIVRARAGMTALRNRAASSIALDWNQQMAQLEAFASSALKELLHEGV